MRKKWEIEDEYRKFCRNNKELALQTLRELTLTPTETGKVRTAPAAWRFRWMLPCEYSDHIFPCSPQAEGVHTDFQK